MIRSIAIPSYFGIRIFSALLLLKLSTRFLSVEDFANFTQFLAFSSLLNMMVVGGAQNGLIRQAAAAPEAELDDVLGAGLALWTVALPLLGVPALLLKSRISEVLTGSDNYGALAVVVTILSLCAGPGQVCWSILSGRKLTGRSLGAQAIGLIASTGACALFITRGNFVGAVVAFATGPVLATLAILPMIRRFQSKWLPTANGLLPLVAYSAATSATLGFTAVVLFGLRSIYRDHFGTAQLGYWLAANRISDMSTQFIGLLMLQAFVPHFAATRDSGERPKLIARYAALGAALTGCALLVFTLAGRPLIHTFLSDSYLPAVPAIRLYMAGDLFRVCGSLAMFTAFATGKPARYAAIEISTMTVMAVLSVVLIKNGEVRGPQIAYAAAWGLTAVLVGCRWALGPDPQRPARQRLHDARRIFLGDIAPRPR